MKNKVMIILIAVLLVVILGGSYFLYSQLSGLIDTNQLTVENEQAKLDNDSSENSTETKVMAMDFTVYDVDGNAVSLSDFRGKPVVVNFWASWCGPCKSEMPEFETMYQEYSENIHFLMVNMTDGYSETLDKATKFIEENGYTFPVYFDTDSDAATTYSVYSIPATYFIDEEGYMIANARGALDMETLQKGIDMIYN